MDEDDVRLFPESFMREVGRPKTGHPAGAKGHEPTSSMPSATAAASADFDYSARLTEIMLLGNVASRVREKLRYDFREGRFTNSDKANTHCNARPVRVGNSATLSPRQEPIMSNGPLRLLILGAHPDDAEFHAGGLASIYRSLGRRGEARSLTDGGAGHFQRPPAESGGFAGRRRRRRDGSSAPLRHLGHPDGELMPTLDVRLRVIREIRNFAPDLVLTHRTCDYHPDHRAAASSCRTLRTW